MKNELLENTKMFPLIWKIGLPMIVSMVLQALYNVVDTAFVINMGELGVKANLALTYAFPVQIFMIAIGVGTGIGINALLSKSLGEKDENKVSKVTGNGIFLMMVIYLLFLLLGLTASRSFIAMQSSGEEEVIKMGEEYLLIVTTLSLGSVGFTIFERFLQANGKALLTMIAQISGAIANIVLDYVFIYPLGMGVKGAALATIIGQFLSFFLALIFHFTLNKGVKTRFRDILPSKEVILGIYKVGIAAAFMQALLSLLMLGMNLILKYARYDSELLQGTYGIYYKVQQIPLFASFGLSNALITIVSYSSGSGNKTRVKEAIKYGILSSLIVSTAIIIIFESLASPIATLFGLASGDNNIEVVETTTKAIRIASPSYLFMGFTVAIQGILQGFRLSLRPLLLSLSRLAVFVFPVAYLFSLCENASTLIWLTFPIAEIITSILAYFLSLSPIKSHSEEDKEEGLVKKIA